MKPSSTLALSLLALSMVVQTPAVPHKAVTTDPLGDTFGTGADRVDATSFSAETTATDVVIRLSFANPISAPDSGAVDALTGFIDLDVDRSAATGSRPFVDFLSDFATGMGDEFHVSLISYAREDGMADLVDDSLDTVVGRVPVSLASNSLTITIPRSLLGGAATIHAAAVVGTPAEATDTVPNGGFLASGEVSGGGDILLTGNRFRVEVAWRDFAGGTGNGTRAVGSEDSAVLWFFTDDNWELLVKVLDACSINNHFWVFAAATTDVEYTLTVTDTQTGSVRRYTNPLGTAAAATTDTAAFATCP